MAKKRKAPPPPTPKQEPKPEEQLQSQSDEEESDSEEEEEEEEEEESSSSSSEEENPSSSEEEEDDSDESSKREKIRKLLQPFGKDQLIDILIQASSTNSSISQHIFTSVNSDPVHRKIFVHGLGWDSTNETLISAFRPFGEIEESKVILDKTTGKSKGYGFVLFKTRRGAKKALKEPQKKIGNRMTACQLAASGPVSSMNNSNSGGRDVVGITSRKLHVANVGPQISKEKLLGFFSKFGEVEEGPLGIDKATGRFRGFAIFVYKTVEGMKKALEEPIKVFDGLKLQCSVALEGRGSVKNNNQIGVSPVSSVCVGNVGVPSFQLGGLSQMGQGSFGPAGALYLGQNPATFGVMNPLLGMGGSLNHMGFGPSFVGGGVAAQAVNGGGGGGGVLQMGFGRQQGVNTISPSVIGSYGSQAALQSLGSYQGSQLSLSSAIATAPAAVSVRPHSGIGPVGSLPSHVGR